MSIVKRVVFCLLALLASVPAHAQSVVASYADPVGSIIGYGIADGARITRIQQVYRLNGTTFLPTKIAVTDGSYDYVLFGNRYLARIRASDGVILWVVDAIYASGAMRYEVNDIAAAGGYVFLSSADPGGHVARYRMSDGVRDWSVARAVQVGSVIFTPLRLAASGSDAFFALIGGKYLAKMRQADGSIVWQIDISLSNGSTVYGVTDVTVGGGYVYVSSLDSKGTIRKFSASTGALVWSVLRTYQPTMTDPFIATKLAAIGGDTVMLVFGQRYLARMAAADGRIVWVKDAGLPAGYTTYFPTDIAGIAAP